MVSLSHFLAKASELVCQHYKIKEFFFNVFLLSPDFYTNLTTDFTLIPLLDMFPKHVRVCANFFLHPFERLPKFDQRVFLGFRFSRAIIKQSDSIISKGFPASFERPKY